MSKYYDNLLDEIVDRGLTGPLPAGMISRLRDRECTQEIKDRQQRMIDHGDVDPDYFNR